MLQYCYSGPGKLAFLERWLHSTVTTTDKLPAHVSALQHIHWTSTTNEVVATIDLHINVACQALCTSQVNALLKHMLCIHTPNIRLLDTHCFLLLLIELCQFWIWSHQVLEKLSCKPHKRIPMECKEGVSQVTRNSLGQLRGAGTHGLYEGHRHNLQAGKEVAHHVMTMLPPLPDSSASAPHISNCSFDIYILTCCPQQVYVYVSI